MEKVNSTLILNTLKAMVESKKMIPKEEWITVAFKLNLLRLDETQLLNKMKQEIARKKVEIMKGQEKKNVAACEVEIESSDEFRMMREQESLIYSVDEFIRLAKRAGDNF